MVAGALLVMGRGFAHLVNEGLSKQSPELLDRAAIATALIALCLAFGSYLRTTLVNQVGEQVLAQIRKALFAHVVGLAPGWFETARTGDILACITTDTAIVQTLMTSTISMAGRNLIPLAAQDSVQPPWPARPAAPKMCPYHRISVWPMLPHSRPAPVPGRYR